MYYSEDIGARQLAQSLRNHKIERSELVEDDYTCVLKIVLDDGRMIVIGGDKDKPNFIFTKVK